jgi:hypothetical protein
VTQHELIQTVAAALDTVDGTVSVVDLAYGENSAITRAAHGVGLLLFVDFACIWSQSTSEEVCEGRVIVVVRSFCFFYFDTVNESKGSEEGTAEEDRHVHFAYVPSQPRLQPRQ